MEAAVNKGSRSTCFPSTPASRVTLLKPKRMVQNKYNLSSKDTDQQRDVSSAPPLDKDGKVLHGDTLNPRVLKAQYAVRGELYLKGEELRAQGKEIIATNTGNPQALGAKPLTFLRQVIALCTAPWLLDDPRTQELFPSDAIERAKLLTESFQGGVGAYTDSRGNALVRNDVANFIAERDGHRPNPNHIFLTDGASTGVRMVLSAIIRDEKDAVLVPIPQYPLYSATCTLLGGTLLPYMLHEEEGWALSMEELKEQVAAARAEGLNVRALVFINPGNPTGQCLPESAVKELVAFCYEQRIALMADEVYQELTFRDDRPFISAHKAMRLLGEPYASGAEVVSLHSVSKGVTGECGLRGGYCQLENIEEGAFAQLYKLASINLCPNTIGQVAVSCMVSPPQPGDPSYPLYEQERANELSSLKRRAAMVSEAFDALPGMSCNPTEGAMYSFPKLELPEGALAAAREAGMRLLSGTSCRCMGPLGPYKERVLTSPTGGATGPGHTMVTPMPLSASSVASEAK